METTITEFDVLVIDWGLYKDYAPQIHIENVTKVFYDKSGKHYFHGDVQFSILEKQEHGWERVYPKFDNGSNEWSFDQWNEYGITLALKNMEG